ncbi:MAG: hypothetical protein AAGG75_17335 [Bacteroidota bacterium]
MKKLIVFLTGILLCGPLSAQQLFLEAFSGYNFTSYDLEGFDASAGYVPIGFRIAGGLERLQLGLEYQSTITDPRFTFQDNTGEDIARTEFSNSYYGALLRYNTSSLPAYRFGVIFKLGAGFYQSEQSNFLLPAENLSEPIIEYEPTVGFNAGIGISAPIYTLLHWEIGYMFHYIEWEAESAAALPTFNGSYHSIQVGLSLNLVFGKVRAKCRRLIKSDRSNRGFR